MAASPYRTPDAPPKKRLPLLGDLTVKTPCRVAWKSMEGDERRRFCFACSKEVYDLTAMTDDEAESFLAVHLDDDDECVRLYRRPDGRVLTTDCPVGATRRHRWRAAVAVAGGALAITAVAALIGNLHVPRTHSLARETHSRFEPPRPIPNDPVRSTLPAESPLGLGLSGPTPSDWGRDEPSPPRPSNGPMVWQGGVTVDTPYPPEVISRIVRQRFGAFRACYKGALAVDDTAAGYVGIRFVITRDGSVDEGSIAIDATTTLHSPVLEACVSQDLANVQFPSPDDGRVKVRYQLRFTRY